MIPCTPSSKDSSEKNILTGILNLEMENVIYLTVKQTVILANFTSAAQ